MVRSTNRSKTCSPQFMYCYLNLVMLQRLLKMHNSNFGLDDKTNVAKNLPSSPACCEKSEKWPPTLVLSYQKMHSFSFKWFEHLWMINKLHPTPHPTSLNFEGTNFLAKFLYPGSTLLCWWRCLFRIFLRNCHPSSHQTNKLSLRQNSHSVV